MRTTLRIVAVIALLITTAANCFALDVLVNQVGFERYAPKVFRAQRTTDYAYDGTFSVKRVSDNVTVLSGTLTRKGGLWDKYYWEGDFGALTIDGDYYIAATVGTENANSYNFAIGNGALLSKTGKLTYQYFTAQRCGAAVSFQYVNRSGSTVTWSHNSCHTDDGYIYSGGPHIDGVGGWHDAGDYGKYGHGFAGNPVFDLLWLYDSNRTYFDAIDTNSNGIADILDEALWQARWLVKIVQANGHVMEKFRQRRSGASWVKPENDTDRIIGTSDDRWIDIGSEATPQEIVVCASLIRMHRVLASKSLSTENFAQKALDIWNHRVAIANSEGGHNNLGSGMHHVFAGLDLYAVYSQQDCWDRALQKVDEMAYTVISNPGFYDIMDYAEGPGYDLGVLAWFARTYPSEPLADDALEAAETLMNRNITYLASPVIGLVRRIEGGQFQYFPANPSLGINRLYGLMAWGAIESYKTTGNANYLRFALDQYDWILGANYNKVCMMEAAGDYHLNKYHTRYDTFITNGIEPGVVPNGYIRSEAGLPWIDFGTGSVSVQTNEGWLPNQAAYAMALAGMGTFSTNPQTAYSGVINLPGTVQAENYDNGGEGIACHDRTLGNNGAVYRDDNVDIETCGDTGGGYSIGWIESGEWLEYSVNVNTSEAYDIKLRVATPSTGGSFHLVMDGQNITNVTSVPNTGGWQTWSDVTVSGVSLSAGQHTLCVYVDSGGWNFNYLQVVDTVPPGPVTNFAATPGNMQNVLTWANPAGEYSGTMVRFKTTGYPTGPTDGTQIYNSTGTSYTHSGLTNGVTYYYSAWAYDEVPNYSTKADATGTPTATYCFQDLFSYSNGNLNGNGGWSGSATSEIVVESQTVRMNGGAGVKDAARTTSCGDPGTGYILVRCKVRAGTGTSNMWSLYFDDTAGANMARWYGAGTTARGRIGGTASVTSTVNLTGYWDELKVKIIPSADTSEFFFNGVSLGVLSHSSQGANNTLGRLRFERMDNSGAAGNYLYFDDLRVGEVDTTPPGSVTGFAATAGDTQNVLNWTNPGGDFTGTRIVFKTSGYPTSVGDGTVIYDGTGTTTTHTGLTNGVTYYYRAYAHDAIPNYAAAAQSSATPIAAFCFRDEFTYSNGALVGNGSWTGTATSSHIAVSGNTVQMLGGAGYYYALRTVSCGDQGLGYIMVRVLILAGAGDSTMWSLRINDTSGNNFARWYGAGTTARGRIGDTASVTSTQTLRGGGLWDSLVVKIIPSTDTSEFYFNGGLIGTLSHSSQGAGSTVGQLKFERIDNSGASGHYVYFDDLRVGGG